MTYRVDSPLLPLTKTEHPVADLVSDFLAVGEEWSIDSWFSNRTEARFQDESLAEQGAFDLDQIQLGRRTTAHASGRLLSLRANYFRGFRKQEIPIDLNHDLVVIDGRNSSGKTSLAEAIEWLLTGQLARREYGDSKELANCIAHRLKPDEEVTWVEAEFGSSGHIWKFRRELLEDYNSKSTSICVSTLFLNGEFVDDSDYVLDSLFSGEAPLLMQHTLQRFVFDPPPKRRDYFERLLNVDGITQLIQKAVVGDNGLARFTREGGKPLSAWTEEFQSMSESAPKFLRDVAAGPRKDVATQLDRHFSTIAAQSFGIAESTEVEDAERLLQEMQRLARQREFPLLDELTPKRNLDPEALSLLSTVRYQEATEALLASKANFLTVIESKESILDAQRAISRSLDVLRTAGLIRDEELQHCPLCAFEDFETLSKARIEEVSAWNLVRKTLSTAKKDFESETIVVRQAIEDLVAVRTGLIPCDVQKSDLEAVGTTQFADEFQELHITYNDANQGLLHFDELSRELVEKLTATELQYDYGDALSDLYNQLPKIESHARKYEQAFAEFEEVLSQMASMDQDYADRQTWLSVVNSSSILVDDLIWDGAIRVTQRELESIRSSLIEFRQRFLERRRTDFGHGMTEIWSLLREDRYSGFKHINIPKPRGKGFPVKIEVTARLDDGTNCRDIDALNVMSESQVNAIGIAAFITRSRLLGHRCLIMDDPVQSMDDEHFKSFANELLNYLRDNGFQVIVLTHSDLFARDISHYHFDYEDYVTLEIAHSRRNGIQITEGNRRVAERLKLAEDYADDGNLGRAWYFVRLAIERLYTVIYIKYGPDNFDPRSWAEQTAEHMWEGGVNAIVAKIAPGSADRLKEILGFADSGAHDKPELGFTDLIKAVKFLRPLLSKLRVGG